MHTIKLRQAARGGIPAELLSPAVDGRYQTVWQFLAEHEPGVLGLLDEDGGALRKLIPDDLRARAIASRDGEPVVTLEAPAALRVFGHFTVGCYTRAVLFQLYP